MRVCASSSVLFRFQYAAASTLLLPAIGIGCHRPADATRQPSSEVSRAPFVNGYRTGVSNEGAAYRQTITGFKNPESVRYDPELDVWYVSNINGFGSVKDNNGSISWINAADPSKTKVLVEGGVNGATLHAPKGLALHGDTIWVTDIDAVRGFNRRTGAPVGTIDFTPQHAVQLNDIAVGPDSALYITDTGILMVPEGALHTGPDRIFRVGKGASIATIDSGPQLKWPNGITWDPTRKSWILLAFDPFSGDVRSKSLPDTSNKLLRTGKGNLDGVEVTPSGAILFSCWSDSSVHIMHGNGDVRLVREVPYPADIGFDTKRNVVAIPLTNHGHVQLWALPQADKTRN